jgi:Bacteriophage minor capsid protein
VATLLENFRTALVDASVNLRDPRVNGAEHPLWLEPRGGAIAPGEVNNADENDDDLVASVYKLPGLTTGPYEGDTYRYDNLSVFIRAYRPPDAYELEQEMREVLHDRRNWDMGEMRIIESMVFAELAPIGNSSEQGFAFRIEYSLQRYLTDQPGE